MNLRRLARGQPAEGAREASNENTWPDVALPRESLLDSFEGEPGPCPRCRSRLIQSSQTYEVATRRGRRLADSLIMGSDFGWFCPGCPIVVINGARVCEMISLARPSWNIGSEYLVLGILNFDAIPPEKRNLPFGTEDNPTPLVPFSNLHRAMSAGTGANGLTRVTRKRPFSKKRRR